MFYNKWRDYDLLTSLLSILGLVVAIIDVSIISTQNRQHEYCLSAFGYDPNLDFQDSIARYVVTITSLLAGKGSIILTPIVISITLRHYQKTQWLNYEIPKEL